MSVLFVPLNSMFMGRTIIIILLLTLGINAIAQPSPKIYKLKITTKTGRVKSGYLREMTDSTLVISPQPLSGSPVESVKNRSIQSISVRERHAVWKGTLIGAGAGAFVGGLIGYASYEKPSCSGGFCFDLGPEADTLGGAILGGAAGAIIGLVAGSSSKQVKLNSAGSNSFDNLDKYIITPKQ